MEQTRSLEIKVGVFVVLATVLTLGFIIALGGDKAVFRRQLVTIENDARLKTPEASALAGSIGQVAGHSVRQRRHDGYSI